MFMTIIMTAAVSTNRFICRRKNLYFELRFFFFILKLCDWSISFSSFFKLPNWHQNFMLFTILSFQKKFTRRSLISPHFWTLVSWIANHLLRDAWIHIYIAHVFHRKPIIFSILFRCEFWVSGFNWTALATRGYHFWKNFIIFPML